MRTLGCSVSHIREEPRRQADPRSTKGSGLSAGNRVRRHRAIAAINSAGRNKSGAGRGDKRRSYKVDPIVVRVDVELDIVLNLKDAIAATDHGLLIQAVSKPDSRSELLFR